MVTSPKQSKNIIFMLWTGHHLFLKNIFGLCIKYYKNCVMPRNSGHRFLNPKNNSIFPASWQNIYHISHLKHIEKKKIRKIRALFLSSLICVRTGSVMPRRYVAWIVGSRCIQSCHTEPWKMNHTKSWSRRKMELSSTF